MHSPRGAFLVVFGFPCCCTDDVATPSAPVVASDTCTADDDWWSAPLSLEGTEYARAEVSFFARRHLIPPNDMVPIAPMDSNWGQREIRLWLTMSHFLEYGFLRIWMENGQAKGKFYVWQAGRDIQAYGDLSARYDCTQEHQAEPDVVSCLTEASADWDALWSNIDGLQPGRFHGRAIPMFDADTLYVEVARPEGSRLFFYNIWDETNPDLAEATALRGIVCEVWRSVGPRSAEGMPRFDKGCPKSVDDFAVPATKARLVAPERDDLSSEASTPG